MTMSDSRTSGSITIAATMISITLLGERVTISRIAVIMAIMIGAMLIFCKPFIVDTERFIDTSNRSRR